MGAHFIPHTPTHIHQFFETDEFQTFLNDPYKNIHINNMRSVLAFFTDPHSLLSIESDMQCVFTQDHAPARNLFQYELDRIKKPVRSLPNW